MVSAIRVLRKELKANLAYRVRTCLKTKKKKERKQKANKKPSCGTAESKKTGSSKFSMSIL